MVVGHLDLGDVIPWVMNEAGLFLTVGIRWIVKMTSSAVKGVPS
jgi:hypothetical protein